MNYHKLLLSGITALKSSGDEEAENDARELLFFAGNLDLSSYAFRMNESVPSGRTEAYMELIRRRCSHEPLQYITHTAHFYGYDFYVDQSVLIPRYDTETLVNAVEPFLKPGMRLLDLCTGSGCILLSLLKEKEGLGLLGTGSDISGAALVTAEKNAEKLGVCAKFILSDLFAKIDGTYDIITANPPYIRTDESEGLAQEVRLYEPPMALYADGDGLSFYRKIIGGAVGRLKSGGILAFEIGCSQKEEVVFLMQKAGFETVSVRKDLTGRDRVVIGGLND